MAFFLELFTEMFYVADGENVTAPTENEKHFDNNPFGYSPP